MSDIQVTDEEVIFVAHQMDVGDKLKWGSTEHHDEVEIGHAKAAARHAIIAHRAVLLLANADLPSTRPLAEEPPAAPAGWSSTDDAALQPNSDEKAA
jgi:hypothetical protein